MADPGSLRTRQPAAASRPGKEAAKAPRPDSPGRMHRGWYSAHVVTDVLPLEAALLVEAVQALPRLQSLSIQLARVSLMLPISKNLYNDFAKSRQPGRICKDRFQSR